MADRDLFQGGQVPERGLEQATVPNVQELGSI